MFRNKMKIDYQIKLPTEAVKLINLSKVDPFSYRNDERLKLAILVDIYNGYYFDEKYKSDSLAKKYSEILVAFCHFNGYWIPYTKNEDKNPILAEANKYEKVSGSITTLIRGNKSLAFAICENTSLLDDYIDKHYESEMTLLREQVSISDSEHTFTLSNL